MNEKHAGTVMALVALLTPFMITVTRIADAVTVYASLWMLQRSGSYYDVFLGPMEWLAMSPFTLMRLIFVYQVFRYYRGKSTRRNTIILGVLVESPIWLASLQSILPSWGLSVSIPLPIILCAGVLLVWTFPRLEAAHC
jgi:hypothetical protein